MRGHEIFLTVSGVVYLGLMTSALVVLTTLPLIVVLLTTDPARTWPLLAVLATLAGPALTAAFVVFRDHTDAGSGAVARTYLRAWRRGFGRSAAIAGLTSATVTVLSVDVAVIWGDRIGAVAIPVLATGALVAAVTGVMALVVSSEHPAARLRDVLRAALFISIRRWYAAAVTVAALGILWALVAQAPAIGLGVATAPLLYVVWATSRHAIRAVLDAAQPA